MAGPPAGCRYIRYVGYVSLHQVGACRYNWRACHYNGLGIRYRFGVAPLGVTAVTAVTAFSGCAGR
jgi:hypothetical protein